MGRAAPFSALSLLLCGLASGQGTASRAQEALQAAPGALASITAQDLESRARALASDELEGRMTGSPGQRKAAELFAKRFKKLGLRSLGDKKGRRRAWYQAWPIDREGFDAKRTGLFEGSRRLTRHGAVFVPRKLRRSKKITLKGKLVFAGRGEVTEKALRGAVAVVHFKSPGQNRPGEGNRLVAKMRGLAKDAANAGAKALVLVAAALHPAFLSQVNYGAAYPGKPVVVMRGRRNRFAIDPPRLPTLVLSGQDAEAVLRKLAVEPKAAYDADNVAALGQRSRRNYTLSIVPTSEKAEALNVCALLPGRDPKLDSEAVLFSCHMDHLGLSPDGQVFNGADDNASGCAAVLEIAEAFAKLKGGERPRRSVIFLAVSGEELGLWGSEWFADNPTWPLSKVVADINMDMLGRSTAKIPKDTVAITPTHRHREYSTLAQDAALLGEALGLRMGDGDWLYARSDHFNFAKKGIPVVFFTDDEHPDYHQLTDTADKLEYDKIEKIARLAFLVGYRAANANGRPKRLGPKDGWH